MEYWMPIVFMAAMGIAMFAYVVLDGYDLGIGLLLPLADDAEKDVMIASIGPFWDANETWIVLGVGILLIAFPQAYGTVLTTLYIPATLMLMGLILRGVAFDFRVKAGAARKHLWNRLFFVGSLVASVCQGWMLGDYVTGLLEDATGLLFATLIALTLPALYVMLGAAWLLIKTEGALFEKARRWGRLALLPMGAGLLLVSIATPVVSPEIAARWFTLPAAIGLLPIPLATSACYGACFWFLGRASSDDASPGLMVFACLVLICLLCGLGLAYSVFPWVILGQLDIWQAASSIESLKFTFVGVVITLPMIIVYTLFIYRIFGGKATELRYD